MSKQIVNTGRVSLDVREQKKVPKPGVKLKSNGHVDVEYMRAKENQLVKGIFRYHELPGGALEFPFRKYKGDPVDMYNLVDGGVYSLPLAVAKHLNSNCAYKVYDYVKGDTEMIGGSSNMSGNVDNSGKVMRVTSEIRRTSFQSLEFSDDVDITDGPKLSVVETV